MLRESIASEITLFLYSALVGVFLSALYDLFRALRKLAPHKRFAGLLVAAEDLCYCLCATAVYIIFIFAANLGIARLYSAISVISGFVVWHLLFGNVFVKICVKTVKLISALFGFALKPVGRLLDMIYKIAASVLCKATINIKNAKKLFIFEKKRYIIYSSVKSGRIFKTKASGKIEKTGD